MMSDIGIPEDIRNREPEHPELPSNVVKEEIYRIRNREGMYSKGGVWVSWSKKGKVWKKESHLKTHLGQNLDNKSPRGYNSGCVVEKVTRLCVESVEEVPLVDYLNEIEKRRRKEEIEAYERHEKAKRKKEYELYLNLKEKFENE